MKKALAGIWLSGLSAVMTYFGIVVATNLIHRGKFDPWLLLAMAAALGVVLITAWSIDVLFG